jgi:tRNA A37 threonylcarbamoyladenosine synthetase subunit TsaC/SUA5/YrdC
VDAALESLAGTPDLVLDGDLTPGGEPSTLVDLTGDESLIVRSGACRWRDFDSEDF